VNYQKQTELYSFIDKTCLTLAGGGGVALFGTGNLHTWAASVGEIHARFTDRRRIDRTKLMDDSAYRFKHMTYLVSFMNDNTRSVQKCM